MFNVKNAIVFVAIFAGFAFGDKLKLSIYYEALCGDSINFIKNQLYPAYEKLSDDLELDFVPYGKAIHNFANGKWHFVCQHGPEECYGNKLQACALAQKKPQKDNVGFVSCIMSARDPSSLSAALSCSKANNISSELLKKCAASDEGSELLAKHGEKTQSLDTTLSFVPTIVVNGTDNMTNKFLYSFFDSACQLINNLEHTHCKAAMARASARSWQPQFYFY